MGRAVAVIALALAGCATNPGQPDPFAKFRQYAPAASVAAQLPLYSNGGEAYQDHAGPAYAVRAAPPAIDTGGERIPDFPLGGAAIAQGSDAVIMPNGGERIVQSVNSMP